MASRHSHQLQKRKLKSNHDMSNTIGILGTGRMAVRLAQLFAGSGNHVILGSRTPERAARITRGLGVAVIKLPQLSGACLVG
jgi:glutamyl-tRNA reductase